MLQLKMCFLLKAIETNEEYNEENMYSENIEKELKLLARSTFPSNTV